MEFACSSFSWETKDGRHLLGRTYDQFGDLALQKGAERARSYKRETSLLRLAGSWFLGALGSAAQHVCHLPSGASSTG